MASEHLAIFYAGVITSPIALKDKGRRHDFVKMNQNKLFGFTCSEHGMTYFGLLTVKKTRSFVVAAQFFNFKVKKFGQKW